MTGSEICKRIDPKQAERIRKLKEDLNDLCGGEAVFNIPQAVPADVQEADLEDILAFESVGTGVSLFEGLQRHGMDLPPPEKLDELQSRRKAWEVLNALADLQIFLIGFDAMSGRKLYRRLWSQTLWEGCYFKKRHPGAITVIDVSHKMGRAGIQQYLDNLMKQSAVH
jgi:hypothetical protein